MTYEQRLACCKLARSGKSDAQIAQETGWSVWTIRKWRRAYRKAGAEGLLSHMGRPKTGILGAYPLAVREQIEQLRRTHPGWGSLTVLKELESRQPSGGPALPSRSRVAAFFRQRGLVRKYERHGGVPDPPSVPAHAVHEEWQLDAQGDQPVADLGSVCVINIRDVVSRWMVASYPHLRSRKPAMEDYQLVLRYAFLQCGLPARLSLDHDAAFFDNTSVSPFPSRLQLWLVALGVQVVFIKKPPPLEHAQIERTHQLMTAQTLTGQTWKEQTDLWKGLTQRCQFLNEVYPSRMLQHQPPLQAYPQAIHSGRPYRPEWEADLLEMNRVDSFLSQGRWFRTASRDGEFWLGTQRYYASIAWKDSSLELTFDPSLREFLCRKVGTDLTQRFLAKGLTRDDLMGELALLNRLPAYQLALPFSRDTCRTLSLVQLRSGTTF
jgi:transposase